MDKEPQEPSSGFGDEQTRDAPFPDFAAPFPDLSLPKLPELPEAPEAPDVTRKSCPLAGICSQDSCEWWVQFQDGSGQCSITLLALNTLPGREGQ